jgi:multiple sugar transport system substrate-binding protein
MRTKQVFSVLCMALAMSLLLVGCGPSNAQPEEGVLRVWTTWGSKPDQLQALFDRYGRAGGLPVRVTTGVKSERMVQAMAGPTPPDLVLLSSSDPIQAYYEQGLVEPLGPWIEAAGIDLDDVYAAPLASCAAPNGGYLCLPWGCDVYALFWNKDLFEAAGLDPERPPQTMEELAEYAARLTVRDDEGEIVQIGFVPDLFRLHTGLYAHMFGAADAVSGAADAVSGAAGPQANAPTAIEAMNWERQFYDRHGEQEVEKFVRSFNRYVSSSHPTYAGKRLSCQQCHRTAPPRGAKLPDRGFYTGKVAMVVDGEWQVGPNYISRVQPDLNFGVAPFPPSAGHPERANTSVVEGPVVLLPAGARDKEAAAALLAWVMSPEVVADQAYASSSLPTSRQAARDPRFQSSPNLRVFLDLLTHSTQNPPLDPSRGG